MLKNGSLKILILFYTRRQTAQNPTHYFLRKDLTETFAKRLFLSPALFANAHFDVV